MPYINRDEQNKIVSLFACQQYEEQEYLEDDNAEIIEYLNLPNVKLNKLNEKLTITVSYGELALGTPVGDLATIITGLAFAKLPLYHQILRTVDGSYIPDLTTEQFGSLFMEVFNGINKRDKFCKAIEQASSIQEVNAINIDY